MNGRNFPDWDALYKNESVENMPWFNKNLDSDLEKALKERNITKGNFLDLGTGPGTQAIQLDEKGFEVTATDISKHAVAKAKSLSGKVNFLVDNILHSKLPKNNFDYIFDRGCFHTLSGKDRQAYIKTVKDILADKGVLFLKCFSEKEPGDYGPYRFSQAEIRGLFGKEFVIESIKETVFQGALSPYPKALFVVMRRR